MTRLPDKNALAATAGDFDNALTLPGQVYSDSAFYEKELEVIFSQHWLCVGHRSRLAQPGDFFTVTLGHESVIVVLDDDQQINALLNVCRHRGTRVCAEHAGNARGFLCPYHAWHYDLKGRLKAAPAMDQVENFSRDDYPLVRLKVDSFLGFLFINFADNAPPLAEQFDDFPSLARFNLPSLERVAHHDYTVAANWKLICENYHECYHCRGAHPQLHRVSNYGDSSNAGCSGRWFVGGPMAIRDGFNTLTHAGNSKRRTLSDDAGDQRLVHYFNLLPNFLLSIAPDYVITHHLWPRSGEETFVESEWFFAPEQIAEADFEPKDAIDFWDVTNRQDWALCENAHKGLRSALHRPGRYQTGEDCTHRFDRWYVTTLYPELA